MAQIIIVGMGGHAKVILDCIYSSNHLEAVGYIDLNEYRVGLKYLGPDSAIKEIKNLYPNAKYVIGIGDVLLRKKLIDLYEESGIEFETVIHPSSIVSHDVVIGRGSVVFPRTVINAGSELGQHCIVNTGAVIEHDNIIGNNVHIGPGCVTGGQVRIKDDTLVGLGSSIRNNTTIGEKCIIGCGSVVVGNIDDNLLVYGVPAKQRR